MGQELKFVCQINDFPETQQALDELRAWQKQRDEQKKFIEKQLETMKKEHVQKWRALWDAAVRVGKIDSALDYDEFNMEIGDDWKQLFIKPVKESQHPLAQLLGGIIIGPD